jgi:hypothetical protein
MIKKPVLGMEVRILKSGCCEDDHQKGDIGKIVEISHDDCFRVEVTKGRAAPIKSWWHERKCVTEVKLVLKQRKCGAKENGS